MKTRRSAWTAIGLGALLAASTAASGCAVRAQARVSSEPVHVVDDAPPPPRAERIAMRPGYVFIRGRWENRGGQWQWRAGHWERARSGHDWQAGHWERRGGRYHWIDGRWVVAGRLRVEPGPPAHEVEVRDHRTSPPRGVEVRDHRTGGGAYPTEPPPPPPPERSERRSGYVFIGGHYRWEGGAYVWVPGHWERARSRQTWEPGHWERRGDRYEWIEGRWRR